VTNTDDTLLNAADPPQGEDEWKAPADGFAYAVDLVRFIRKTYGDYFVIAVGGQFFSDCVCTVLSRIFRSIPPSRPNKVGLKCPPARLYVRLQKVSSI